MVCSSPTGFEGDTWLGYFLGPGTRLVQDKTGPDVTMELARSVGPSVNVEEGCRLKGYVDVGIVPTQNDEAHTCQFCRQGKCGVRPRRSSYRCSLALRAL